MVATHSTSVDRQTSKTGLAIGGMTIGGVGTETTFAPQAPRAGLRIVSLTLPPRPPPTALGTRTNEKIPPSQPHVEIDDPEEVNPQEDKPLKDYIQRFLEVATKTKSLSEDARVMALPVELKEISPLWSNLCDKAVYTMNNFLDRAYLFIKLEEAITRAKGSKGGNKKSPDTEAPATEAQGSRKKGGSNGGKRANNDDKKGNSLGAKKPKTRGKPLQDYEPCLTTYSILLAPSKEIYTTTQSVVPYCKPLSFKESGKRDMNKFCHYHNKYGYDTNEFASRLEIKIGGPHIVKNSRKVVESYARSLRHERAKVLEVVECPLKSQCYGCEPITFRELDSYHVTYPHNDPLLIDVQIANMTVARLMYSFSGADNSPCGKIKLPLTVGTAQNRLPPWPCS
uniref:Uncharacterized protein n=1 Tax=Cannabis sativa TaxID=3483 RepID=A0A803PRM1_CANSA